MGEAISFNNVFLGTRQLARSFFIRSETCNIEVGISQNMSWRAGRTISFDNIFL